MIEGKNELYICWSYGEKNSVYIGANSAGPMIFIDDPLQTWWWRKLQGDVDRTFTEEDPFLASNRHTRGWSLTVKAHLDKMHFTDAFTVRKHIWLPYGPTLLDSAMRAGYVIDQLLGGYEK